MVSEFEEQDREEITITILAERNEIMEYIKYIKNDIDSTTDSKYDNDYELNSPFSDSSGLEIKINEGEILFPNEGLSLKIEDEYKAVKGSSLGCDSTDVKVSYLERKNQEQKESLNLENVEGFLTGLFDNTCEETYTIPKSYYHE